jgi:GR25 family glycosyltransferase involved in LPS biosynthesis
VNLARPVFVPALWAFRYWLKFRRLLPKEKCLAFGAAGSQSRHKIGKIHVINLDRQPDRWAVMERELGHVLDMSGQTLAAMSERYSAVDARDIAEGLPGTPDIDPIYTLEDQLFVEPQPSVLPNRLQLDRPIVMTPPEIAVALSHIAVWRRIAAGKHDYCLVLEDDVWFPHGFAGYLEKAWTEIVSHGQQDGSFDILYLSYTEVKGGAQKTLLSEHVFHPVRGLWCLSGYVLSREGARRLLERLPCRGPVDLWMNHQFGGLSVRATRKSLIAQRLDGGSTNSYSILPVLNRIGAIDSERASLFQIRPREEPVFVFGPEGSGLSSLAMALSMLGYRCCSDLKTLPLIEHRNLISGSADRVFNAYVNIGGLAGMTEQLRQIYPRSKFIFTSPSAVVTGGNNHVDCDLVLRPDEVDSWRALCEHLSCAPPICAFPNTFDVGQRDMVGVARHIDRSATKKALKRDRSPWVIESRSCWEGIRTAHTGLRERTSSTKISLRDSLNDLESERWWLRDDTFSSNLALFRSSNVEFRSKGGALLNVRRESLGVRDYSAAAISSTTPFLYGRFEAVIRPANVSGVVTGFFLHRDSPRQEIDVELAGNRPDRLLVNVFYNPGGEGAPFDYGYRGAPSHVDLGFDASRSAHCFTIEWQPNEIRWLVDGQLVHRRVDWNPTPIPHLPMNLHVNSWPCRSRELAGRLNARLLPATTVVESIAVDANQGTPKSEQADGLSSCKAAEQVTT